MSQYQLLLADWGMAIHKFLTLGLIINYEVVAVVVVAVVRVEIFLCGSIFRKTNKDMAGRFLSSS